MIAILGVFAAVVALLVVMLALTRSRDEALSRRTDLIAPPPPKPTTGIKPAASAASSRLLADLPAFFGYRMQRNWGVSAGPPLLLTAGVVGATATWVATGMIFNVPEYVLIFVALAAFFLVPRFILARQQRRADAQFAELLPDAIDMVGRIVRAGLPVGVAIKIVAQEAPEPLRTIFRRIADQIEIGMALDEALATGSMAVGNPDFRFLAVAVALQQSTGGNLAATLDTLGEIIRKRRAVRAKARAATAEVRISGIVLGAIPFFVSAALMLVAPSYLDPLVVDRRGNVILGAALLCLLLAGLTMRTMIRSSLRS